MMQGPQRILVSLQITVKKIVAFIFSFCSLAHKNNANAFLVTESLYITLIRHTRPIVFLCKNIMDNGSERN